MPLQLRRGLSSDLTTSVIPSEGEPIFALDTGKLYIGDGINNGQALQPVNRDIFLGDLQDVDGFSLTLDGYILRYNGTTSNWEAQELLISSFPEFSLGVGSEGSVLRFDDNPANPTYGTYTTAFLNTNDLGDVDTSASPIDGDVLVYDATSGHYTPQAPSGGSISSASDVTLTSLSDGQALLYDSASGTWQNQTLSSGGSLSLDGLTDVNAPSPSDGDIIAYDSLSSQWVSTAPSGGSTTLNGLTDVNLASPAGGDLLSYDSVAGEWVNSQFAAGLSTINDIYVGANATHEAVISNVTINFVNGFDGFNTLYSGISDNLSSTGASKECLTADGNGGLNWEQILLENVASGTLQNAVNDTAAASAGVPIGGIYRDGSTLKVRVS